VLPLDDREYERVAEATRARARSRYVYYPGMARIERLNAPDVTDCSWNLAADVTIPAGGAEGVVLASGTRFAGYVLYLQAGRCVWEYVYSQNVRHVIRSETAPRAGRIELRYEFTRTGPRRGRGALFVDAHRWAPRRSRRHGRSTERPAVSTAVATAARRSATPTPLRSRSRAPFTASWWSWDRTAKRI